MRQRVPKLYLRLKLGKGEQPLYPAILNPNGTVRPFYALVNGEPLYVPTATYYIRYRDKSGKRHYEFQGGKQHLELTGTDLKGVSERLRMWKNALAAEDAGLTVNMTKQVHPRCRPKPAPTELPSVAEVAPATPTQPNRILLSTAIDAFVTRKLALRRPATARGYRYALAEFLKQSGLTYLDQIDDAAILGYVCYLRKLKMADKTITCRIAPLSAMLRRHKMSDVIDRDIIPKPEGKEASSYDEETLKKLFSVANPEERFKFKFFWMTGMREKEVAFASWQDIIDWERGVFRITSKPKDGFRIKDNDERSFPIEKGLLAELRARFAQRRHDRWIFPTKNGYINGHMLRELQELAFRAGLNCGFCRTRGGQSCSERACCRQWGLHKFRRTFATRHHQCGVPVHQLMVWLGHADMKVTLRYLVGSKPGEKLAQEMTARTWAGLEI